MNGIIHAYSTAVSAGLINGADGNQYAFNRLDWSGTTVPFKHQAVTFGEHGRNAGMVRGKDIVNAA